LRCRIGREGLLGDQGVELVVAQIAGHAHLLHAGFKFGGLQIAADGAVERQRGAVAPGLQREGLHQGVGQHGDLVARHIHGGQAVARDLLPVGIARQRQRRGGDVNAQPHPAIVQPLQRKRIVDLGGGRVVDAERRSRSQRQRVVERRHRQRRKGRALGKAFQQKALHVKRPRRGDGPGVAQQGERAMPGLLDRQRHGLELRAVFVGFEQDLIELVGNFRRAATRGQFGGEGVDLA
jgi:hypothetical protein